MPRMLSLFIFVLLLIGVGLANAQTPAIESPSAGRLPEWSADSQLFAYQNTSKDLPRTNSTNSEVFKEHPYWEAFKPFTGEWFESTVWPLYPDLSTAERAIFQTEGFVRTSPDGEILIYPSLNKHLTIANRTTQQILETDIDYPVPNVEPIWWSEDGQGVAIEGSGDSPYVADPIYYYLRLRNRLDMTQTKVYFVRRTEPLVAENRLFRPVQQAHILDVRQHQILTTVSEITNVGNAYQAADEAQSYLLIWNPERPDASTLIDAFNGHSIRAAAFVSGDSNHILVVLGNSDVVGQRFEVQPGLYVYNIQTQGMQFLADFDGYFIEYPYFSPDGEWLAVKLSGISQYAFFRTDDLLVLPPLTAPTAFPTFTPVPTYTPTPTNPPPPMPARIKPLPTPMATAAKP